MPSFSCVFMGAILLRGDFKKYKDIPNALFHSRDYSFHLRSGGVLSGTDRHSVARVTIPASETSMSYMGQSATVNRKTSL